MSLRSPVTSPRSAILLVAALAVAVESWTGWTLLSVAWLVLVVVGLLRASEAAALPGDARRTVPASGRRARLAAPLLAGGGRGALLLACTLPLLVVNEALGVAARGGDPLASGDVTRALVKALFVLAYALLPVAFFRPQLEREDARATVRYVAVVLALGGIAAARVVTYSPYLLMLDPGQVLTVLDPWAMVDRVRADGTVRSEHALHLALLVLWSGTTTLLSAPAMIHGVREVRAASDENRARAGVRAALAARAARRPEGRAGERALEALAPSPLRQGRVAVLAVAACVNAATPLIGDLRWMALPLLLPPLLVHATEPARLDAAFRLRLPPEPWRAGLWSPLLPGGGRGALLAALVLPLFVGGEAIDALLPSGGRFGLGAGYALAAVGLVLLPATLATPLLERPLPRGLVRLVIGLGVVGLLVHGELSLGVLAAAGGVGLTLALPRMVLGVREVLLWSRLLREGAAPGQPGARPRRRRAPRLLPLPPGRDG